MKTVTVMGYDVFAGDMDEISITDTKTIIGTLNAHAYIVAKKDIAFQSALKEADILLADGSGVTFASYVLTDETIKKMANYEVFLHLLKKLDKDGGSCFFLGASETTLGKINERLKREYPNISADFFSPPYKPEFSSEESQMMIDKVNAFKPDLLLVGMTAPKQEKWVNEFKHDLDARMISSIGANFDFFAGTVNRPDKIWLDLHLEWLARLLAEPKRLWRRSLISIPLFIWEILLIKLNIRQN
jgi:N-acetylglucosaminyldiphosphoundecaprenol N-acetyl-beta-D-mannosaminyltransferase